MGLAKAPLEWKPGTVGTSVCSIHSLNYAKCLEKGLHTVGT